MLQEMCGGSAQQRITVAEFDVDNLCFGRQKKHRKSKEKSSFIPWRLEARCSYMKTLPATLIPGKIHASAAVSDFALASHRKEL